MGCEDRCNAAVERRVMIGVLHYLNTYNTTRMSRFLAWKVMPGLCHQQGEWMDPFLPSGSRTRDQHAPPAIPPPSRNWAAAQGCH